MNSVRILAASCVIFSMIAPACFADEVTIEKSISGYSSMEEGQIVQGTFTNTRERSDHVWVQRMYTGLVGSVQFNPLNIEGNIGCEMRISNEFPRTKGGIADQGLTTRLYFYPYLTEADFKYHLGDNSTPLFSVTAGYFPIKYNENSRNLGEYLFRSGAYPQTLVTDFDFAATRLMGVNLSSSPIKGLTLNLILNSNIEWQAIGDLNLSGLASYNLADIFEIGAGVSQSSIVSADSKITDGDPAAIGNNEIKYVKSIKGADTTFGLLTFRGTKVMAMASLDPKNLLKTAFGINMDFFGKEDCKLYSEAAVLGVKDYPVTLDGGTDYSDIMKRIPVMFGFNFPAFKAFDVISVEGEWFGSILPNDLGGVVQYDEPIPLTSNRLSTYLSDSTHKQYIDDNWKWSVYAKRTFKGHFQVIGQVASDHLRWFAQDWVRQEWEEALRNPHQFYYRFKLAYLF